MPVKNKRYFIFSVTLHYLKIRDIVTINEKRNHIINVFCWFATPKIDFGNDKLNETTATHYESETIQTNLLCG